MQEIDLGEDIEFQVKYRGAVYQLREPSAKEISSYQKRLEGAGAEDATSALLAFVSNLGMPIDIAEAMPASKLNALVRGLLDGMSKKN